MTVRELLSALTRHLKGQQVALPADTALDAQCTGVEYDSRTAKPGSVFVALPGQKADGAAFASQAVASGAVAIVSERQRPENVAAPWVVVGNARLALAHLASEFFGHPSRRMAIIFALFSLTTLKLR